MIKKLKQVKINPKSKRHGYTGMCVGGSKKQQVHDIIGTAVFAFSRLTWISDTDSGLASGALSLGLLGFSATFWEWKWKRFESSPNTSTNVQIYDATEARIQLNCNHKKNK